MTAEGGTAERPDLDRLAESCGILLRWRDIWGEAHAVSDDTKRALLVAMGVSARDESASRAALRSRARREWRMLPAVLVARESDETIEVPLGLPEARSQEPLDWVLELEGGGRAEGRFVPSALPIVERREIDGKRLLRFALALQPPRRLGYHRLSIGLASGRGRRTRMSLIVAPDACYVPASVEETSRVWGLAVQLYSLRSSRNWGVGDFTDLLRLTDAAARMGAGILGINPLHALFPANPDHASPYAPSSRNFLNPIYLDIEAIPEFAECEEARTTVHAPAFQETLAALRESERVEYAEVSRAKRIVLEMLYRHFRTRHLARRSARGRAFRSYRAARGAMLRAFGLFEALQEHVHRSDPAASGWQGWPEAYRRPGSPEVAAFAKAHRERIEFFQYAQWLCDEQLESVGRRARERRLKVGLYLDLAVGVDAGGFDAWWRRSTHALGARLGAPPDDFNLKGQDWGLPPWIPDRLRGQAYAPFVECLRANMRHARALRLDHVMGLMRAFWLPPGRRATDGAYVRYPFRDLLGILALESRRNGCMVIGEDLGTVPDEVRNALRPMRVLAYRLFYFMKDEGGAFVPPATYPEQALVAVTTHDLPTLAGFWQGRDIAVRTRLDLYPNDGIREKQIVSREEDRRRLLLALNREGLLPDGTGVDPAACPVMSTELAVAVHRYLARTPSRIFVLQMEDAFGQVEQANLPGTVDEHPNWRRKLSVRLEAMERHERMAAIVRVARLERGASTDTALSPAGA